MSDVLLPGDGRDKPHHNDGRYSSIISVERSFVTSFLLLNLTLQTIQGEGAISSTEVVLNLQSLMT
jgi:hypothetical protein